MDVPSHARRIVFYCQHLSGIGHYMRSRELVRALAHRHELHFVTGGVPVPGVDLGATVNLVSLPAIHRVAGEIVPIDPNRTIVETMAERMHQLAEAIKRIRPDTFIVEHFPLGKWELGDELLTAIRFVRSFDPSAQVLASVRDFPASNELSPTSERRTAKIVSTLNEHFSGLLVHSDPAVVRFESQFTWAPEIRIPIRHTGFVSEPVVAAAEDTLIPNGDVSRGYVLVSSGGLDEQDRLANLCIAAWRILESRGATDGRDMVIVAGLTASQTRYETLARSLAGGSFHLRRFNSQFLAWMQGAALSISQGGYNTTMNVLATRSRALLAPNRRMIDQTLRAQLFQKLGLVESFDVESMTPEGLADLIAAALVRPRPEHDLNLNGTQQTSELLDTLPWTTTAPKLSTQASAATITALEETIPQRIARFAAERPTQPAVKTPAQVLTFGDLTSTANRLARLLQQRHGNSSRPVALLVEQSGAQAVGLLGILKTGRCYVPLKTSHPPQRLEYLLRDSQAELLVTNHHHLPLAQRLVGGRLPILNLDTIDPTIAADEIDMTLSPDNLASITYTSGSTGKPKGVVHTHRTTLYLGQAAGVTNLTPCDRVASLGSSISFNRILLQGATSYPWNVREDGYARLAEWLESEAITVILTVPSVLRSFVATLTHQPRWSALRRIVLTGETLYRQDIDLFRQHFPAECLLVNELGSSETKTYAQFVIECQTEIGRDLVSVGRPLAGRKLRLLDDDGNPVQSGEVGEIVVHSQHLSPGYWGQPELTNSRFFPDPETLGERVYHTGDLAYQQDDGTLVHVGRRDFQLKIRGQRVELAEIEGALRSLEGIREAVVIAREDQLGDRRLVAYVVADSIQRPTVNTLSQGLRTKLPDYMLPAVFVFLDALPKTPDGKIHRLALPAPGRARPPLATSYVAPRSTIETTLTQLCMEVLKIDDVGVHDDFFDLGGDSLRATQLVSRITQHFRVDLPLREIFRLRSMEAVAEALASPTLQPSQSLNLPTPSPRLSGGEEHAPLASYTQQRLWLLEQIQPSSAYNESIIWRLRGPLNVEALRRALSQLVARHEVLRTTLYSDGDEVRQMIGPPRDFDLPILSQDRQPTEEASLAALEELLVQEFRRPFDLSRDLMLRGHLVRWNDQDHILALTLHHVAMDGWSLGVLKQDLGAFYNAICNGEEPRLTELPLQFADYARWQRENLTGVQLQPHLTYWKRQLEGAPDTLDLPVDGRSSGPPSLRGERYSLMLAPELLTRLQSLSRDAGTSLYVTMASAFAILLGRYTDSADIVFGTPIANRRYVALERLIGFFVNMLVLRINLSGQTTFRELLRRVHDTVFDAFAHQDAPFDRLVEELRPQRRPGRLPLFNIVFAMQNAPRSNLDFCDVESDRLFIFHRTSKFDLYLGTRNTDQGVRLTAVANADLLNRGALERLVGHYVLLLEGIAAEADRHLSSLPYVTPLERRQLLTTWNATARDVPANRSVSQLFEDQVERSPNAVALIADDQELTYRELNERANQLARFLRSAGVVPGTLVGLCVERSPALVIGILGILKAGAAYVPLNADDPPERREFVIKDAKIALVVTQHSVLDRFLTFDGQVVCLDQGALQIASFSRLNPPGHHGSDGLAYVMYTSGSTGIPKGVAVPHRAIVRLVFGVDYATFGPDRVFLLLAPISFDASTFELWGALLHGSRLVLATADAFDFRQLERIVQRHKITTLWLTASLFNQIVEHHPHALAGVSEILTGGEALSPPHIRKAQHALGTNVQLINGYGPTENTTFTTCYRIPFPLAPDVDNIPIGRPIGNTQVYLLDSSQSPVPIGVPGELYVAGAGLAIGYLHQPELTAERFLPNPFNSDPSARMYRTGDRCRWRADGNLEFLGRLDHQVKLRGYRIELNEIETVLSEYPDVSQCAVLMCDEDRSGEKSLIAYYMAVNGASVKSTELSCHLHNRLPPYMIPSRFVSLESFPLTSSGKIDRLALLTVQNPPVSFSGSTDAADALELQLLQIWIGLFGRESIGMDENFFELGGHSLLAVRLSAEVERMLGRRIPVATIFQAPTIRSLARLLRESGRTLGAASLVPLQPHGHRPPFFFMHGWGGDVFHFVHLARRIASDQPVYGLQAKDSGDDRQRPSSVEELCSNYVKEIRGFQPEGPYYLGGYSLGGWIAYEVAQQLLRQGQTVRLLALLDTGASCKLPRMIYLRFNALRFAGTLASRLTFHVSRSLRLPWRELWDYGRDRSASLWSRLVDVSRDLANAPNTIDGSVMHTGDYYRFLTGCYRPAKYSGKLDLFASQQTGLKARLLFRHLASGRVAIHSVAGDHFSMLDDQNLESLAQALQTVLLAAQEEPRPVPK